MEIETNEEKVIHPEGMIRLMNGSLLKCEKKASVNHVGNEEGLRLDTTGEFFSASSKRPDRSNSLPTPEKEEQQKTIKLFEKYAFALYERKEEIYSDSRIFLCPVDTGSGLAYTGRSGFTGSTLGAWLEWWDSNPDYRKCKGKDRLVIYIAGSPLSGSNRCSCVTPEGKIIDESFRPFRPVWKSFMEINCRYRQVARQYESYSLQDVIDKLFPKG